MYCYENYFSFYSYTSYYAFEISVNIEKYLIMLTSMW